MSVGLETTAPVTQGKRRRVLWLQRSLLAVLAYLTLLHDPVRGFGLDELGVIALAGVTVLISVLPTKYFAGSGLDFALLLCNLSATAIPVVLSPETAPAPSFFLVTLLLVAVAVRRRFPDSGLFIYGCPLSLGPPRFSRHPQ